MKVEGRKFYRWLLTDSTNHESKKYQTSKELIDDWFGSDSEMPMKLIHEYSTGSKRRAPNGKKNKSVWGDKFEGITIDRISEYYPPKEPKKAVGRPKKIKIESCENL